MGQCSGVRLAPVSTDRVDSLNQATVASGTASSPFNYQAGLIPVGFLDPTTGRAFSSPGEHRGTHPWFSVGASCRKRGSSAER